MWNIFGRYKGKKALPSARQMNLIAAILNHVTQGTGIAMKTPQLPSTDTPWEIGIDTAWLGEIVGKMVTAAVNAAVGVTANSVIGSDSSGKLAAIASLLTAAPSKDKVLTVKKNSTSVTWEDAPEGGGSAENPSSKTNLADSYPGTASANTASWTAGGENGVSVTVLTRVQWSGTYLYGFYRTYVYDKSGRLYSISAETRYTIDTAVTYNP